MSGFSFTHVSLMRFQPIIGLRSFRLPRGVRSRAWSQGRINSKGFTLLLRVKTRNTRDKRCT